MTQHDWSNVHHGQEHYKNSNYISVDVCVGMVDDDVCAGMVDAAQQWERCALVCAILGR